MSLDFVSQIQPESEYSDVEESTDQVVMTKFGLEELKEAYTKVLSEKESQILQLKQHIVDLQTLNKALENEADRLKSELDKSDLDKPFKTSFSKYDF